MDIKTLNISLPAPVKEYVEEQTEQGGYSSVSEYMRELVRGDKRKKAEERVAALLLEGLNSGPATPMTADDWTAIRNEALKRIEQRKVPA